ncbi:NACHT domain-containing protein [Verrucosispora sp. ts21]|uniref:NACHT domain-containing protein n=1 Tax=Verrucosispora sp. ts21 TaxID=2069341 RepID=UPI001304CC7D|nr:NACHT domain-containing protein [Verrucosispora sp. ts21]
MRRPKRGPVFETELWLRQRRRRWRTRRERADERRTRRRVDERTARAPRWRRDHRGLWWVTVGGATLLVLWLLFSLTGAVIKHDPLGDYGPSNWCTGSGARPYYCGQVHDFVKGLLTAALAVAVFLFWRYRRVLGSYRKQARHNQQLAVPSAEQDVRDIEVVGREDLCQLMVRRVRDPHNRRPLLLVGSIGTGKTTTLVKLAEMLMDVGVVPVGINLREVQKPADLNFHTLARARFQAVIDTQLHAEGEADKIWRQLWRENRIVVLADGLEEALAGTDQPLDRDSLLREAVGEAKRENLPLVITSRPQDPLRALDAMLLQLEPLSEGAAFEYVQSQGRQVDATPQWDQATALIKMADVADSPFYLRVIGKLYQVNRLDRVNTGPGRAVTRRRLLDEWHKALVEGDLYEDYGLAPKERGEAIEVLSALACLGLRDNSLRVLTNELSRTGEDADPGSRHHTDPSHRQATDAGRHGIRQQLNSRLDKLSVDNPQDLGLAETTGGRLNMVVKQQDGVRFQHGVVQAYLGCRYLDAALRDRDFLRQALRNGPGRELLAALTLYSCQEFTTARSTRNPPGDPDGRVELVRTLGQEAVRTRNRTQAVEMFAAALEMDATIGHRTHHELAGKIRHAWRHYQGDGSITDRPLEDAKIALVHRYGDAARLIDVAHGPEPAYRSLFRMMATETSYLTRLTAARELGRGGEPAIRALRSLLADTDADLPDDPDADADLPDEDPQVRRDRLRQLRAWLAPSLFLFADDPPERPGRRSRSEAEELLRAWVNRLRTDDEPTRIWELQLAQGFRLAANCRHFSTRRGRLAEAAEEALRHSRFWYSHLTLIQALTLLALPENPAEPLGEVGRHGSDPRGLVDYWLAIAGGGTAAPQPGSGSTHPLVRTVADECVAALVDRHPELHCWVDEHEIVGRVGSASPQPAIRRQQASWLPPSHGWAVLKPRAQRLLADVMLLLNLADRGTDDAERTRRLGRSSRSDLPPCLTIDRTAMRVNLTRRQSRDVQPGATCIDDCPFRLCPLPPRGEELSYQMDEAFCANQADLVGQWQRPSYWAWWQKVDGEELRIFWRDMSERMIPAWRK